MAYSHVLAALDLSPESTQVLDRAQDEAGRHGARLSAVTVVKPLTQVYTGLDVAPQAAGVVSFEEQALEQARTRLAELLEGRGVDPADAHVILGTPSQDIREVARSIDADLIVVGTHGRHGLGLLLGSTANAVLHGVQRDVLAVRIQMDEGDD